MCTLLHGIQHKACSEHMSSVANRIEFAVLYTHFFILPFFFFFEMTLFSIIINRKREGNSNCDDNGSHDVDNISYEFISVSLSHEYTHRNMRPIMMSVKEKLLAKKRKKITTSFLLRT